MAKNYVTKKEAYLFNQGKLYQSYLHFGAQPGEYRGKRGVHFAVWAPHAKMVGVCGDFNDWDGTKHPMKSHPSGVWTLFIPGLEAGETYKYGIQTAKGERIYKSDPFAFCSELRPHTASVVAQMDQYKWKDSKWLDRRGTRIQKETPMLIYEVHFGSWRRHEDGAFYTYREMAKELVQYVKGMGYTHIEIMPLMEHPFDGSWGYQTTGYFSVTSRYGSPQDFMFFIDACHRADIGVIMDWVPGHFCKDAHGLASFDGTELYEKEEHRQWGTYKFDFAKTEVRGFLISNALFWLDVYHIDGLRVDGVSSMLFLDFDREAEAFTPNCNGGRENLEAVSFLRELNETVFHYHPDALMIAEESTDWPMVTRPPYDGGLGFSFKWNMGWMNDTLNYAERWFEDRCNAHHLLTFSLMYAFSEDFILPFSHDEVVHGKKSMIGKMPGDNWQKFAGLRAFYLYQMTHPGKKLLFMGTEFAQYIEWKYDEQLEWFMIDYPLHGQFMAFVKTLNRLYLKNAPLWQCDHIWEGFEWIDADNSRQAVLSFIRKDKEENLLIVVINFKPQAYDEFRLGVPVPGSYTELINSDHPDFGGAGFHINGELKSEEIPLHGKEQSINLKLPPLGGLVLKVRPKKSRRRTKGE